MSTSHRPPSDFGRRLRAWRRQRGLTQFELAVRAGTTPRHVSFLETGRSRPGAEMVVRLARELDLPSREQNALLTAAGLPARYSQHNLDTSEIARFSAVIDALLDRHEPLPAAVIDRYGAVLRANKAFERLSPGLVGIEPEALVDLLFGPGPGRDAFVNWEDAATAWLARQRREIWRTGDPRLEALVARAERLIGASPSRESVESLPMFCARMKAGEEILELFTAVVRLMRRAM